MEPTNTLLMGDEVISTTPARETDEIIKSSVDDLVPILGESEVTSVYDDLECDVPITTPVPTTVVTKENFDINSPLGEYVVDFLMENEDVASLPKHLVKYLDNYLLKIRFEDISSLDLPESTPVIDESSLLVTPLPDPEHIYLRIPFDLEDLHACFQSFNHAVSDHLHVYILGILNPGTHQGSVSVVGKYATASCRLGRPLSR
ncbi:hypothetical protein Tco_1577804 [Tanacetum coccineum]